jgi:hypothetical protein
MVKEDLDDFHRLFVRRRVQCRPVLPAFETGSEVYPPKIETLTTDIRVCPIVEKELDNFYRILLGCNLQGRRVHSAYK